MGRCRLLIAAASAAAVWGAGALTAAGAADAAVPAVQVAARAAGSWSKAIEVPGLGALNTGGSAAVFSVSCTSAGNCAVGGNYTDRHGNQGFVAVQRHGRWRRAIEVPGLGALNNGANVDSGADVTSISCTSAGNCAVGGDYTDRHDSQQGFVAVERHGRWGRAIEVPGLGALNTGGGAGVFSISCASAGNCAAGGDYTKGFNGQGFVAVERHGRWGRAIEVPGLATLNKEDAEVNEVSCASAGNCAVGGRYTDRHGNHQAFVAVERHGRWGTAIEVPGLAVLNMGDAEVNTVSCAFAGNCAAGGDYTDHRGNHQAFVAVERNGRWGTAIRVPGLATLNIGDAGVFSVSCASAGSCAAGGFYSDRSGSEQGFVVIERNGRWHRAIRVPGLAALNAGDASVNSVSCTPAGKCAAGGFYTNHRHSQGFVAVERNGRWRRAIEVPGLAALNKGDASVLSVSCAPVGSCTAGGDYADGRGNDQGFVVTQAR